MSDLALLKVGGAHVQVGDNLTRLIEALTHLIRERQLVIVHGGGADIARLQERLGLESRFVDGLRVTDADSLWAAEMALSGAVNKRLAARLVAEGVRAIGISGVDAGLLRARRMVHPKGDLGRVGEITQVEASSLTELLGLGFTPIVSPISLGEDGRPYNVNADHAALAIASALGVREMIFLTDVPGVMLDGEVLSTLSADRALALIESGDITGGMIPKTRSALQALEDGVGSVRITDIEGLGAGTGTWVRG
ncbi:MAG: acetylglutamate kinase [Chloroflexota bacterium]|nr:acetylglutamate kinase [Chloroflexota bacterium]